MHPLAALTRDPASPVQAPQVARRLLRPVLLVMALLVVGVGTLGTGSETAGVVAQLQADRTIDPAVGVAAPSDPVVIPQSVKVQDLRVATARSMRLRILLGVLAALVVAGALRRFARVGRHHTASGSVAARLLLPDRRGPPSFARS